MVVLCNLERNSNTPIPPHTQTHTTQSKEKEKQHSRMQGKQSKGENFPSEERKQSKNHCSPVKLERKKAR